MTSYKRVTFEDERHQVSVYVEYPVVGFPEKYLIRLSGVYLTILDIPVQLRLIAMGEDSVLSTAQLNGALKVVKHLMNQVDASEYIDPGKTYQSFVDDLVIGFEDDDELIRKYYPDISFDWKLRALDNE